MPFDKTPSVVKTSLDADKLRSMQEWFESHAFTPDAVQIRKGKIVGGCFWTAAGKDLEAMFFVYAHIMPVLKKHYGNEIRNFFDLDRHVHNTTTAILIVNEALDNLPN